MDELRRASANYNKLIMRANMGDWNRFVGDHDDDKWSTRFAEARRLGASS